MVDELKAYDSERIYWAVEQVEQEAGDIADLHLDDNLFYIKEDADRLIKFWRTESHNHYERWFSLNKQFDGWFGKVKRCERAERELRHQKYKRCLAMARWCMTEYIQSKCLDLTNTEQWYWRRWHIRWRNLAEKFKEVK